MKTKIIEILILIPILILILALGVFLNKVPEPVPELKMPKIYFGEQPKADEKIVKGWKIYNEKGCFFCHGIEGKGGIKNPNSKGGKISPLQLVAEGYTKEELKGLILRGTRDIAKENKNGPNPPINMPAWKGVLSNEELDVLSEYLMSLIPKEKKEEW